MNTLERMTLLFVMTLGAVIVIAAGWFILTLWLSAIDYMTVAL